MGPRLSLYQVENLLKCLGDIETLNDHKLPERNLAYFDLIDSLELRLSRVISALAVFLLNHNLVLLWFSAVVYQVVVTFKLKMVIALQVVQHTSVSLVITELLFLLVP